MAIDIATARTEIAKLYIAAFNRVPDSAGLNFWVDSYVNKGQSLDQIANNFTNSTEYKAKYPAYQTNAEFVEAIYQNVFGRASDAAGKAYWEARLVSTGADSLTHGTLMQAMVDAAMSNGSTDGTKLTNQATFAVNAVLNNIDNASATAQLANVTSDAASITTATTAATTASQTVAGQTYTLTAGTDNVTASAGNDTINGDVAWNSTSSSYDTATLGAFDVIDGGAGTDTLTITNQKAGTAYTLPGATVTNVENLVIKNDSGAVTAEVSTYAGLQSVSVTLGTANDVDVTTKSNVTSVSVTKGNTTPTITDSGSAATTADKLATVSLNAMGANTAINSDALTTLNLTNTANAATITAAAGTRALTVNTDGVTGGTVTDATATSVTVNNSTNVSTALTVAAAAATAATINATGKASTITALTGSNIATVNVGGDAAVTVSAQTLKATAAITSTNTAGVTFSSALGTTQSFAGGAGADVITVGATTVANTMGAGNDTVTMTAAAGTNGSVDAGEGTDTLSMTAAVATTVSATTTFEAGISNFEKVSVGQASAATTVQLANIDDINYLVSAGTAGAAVAEVQTIDVGTTTRTDGNITVGGIAVAVLAADTAAQTATKIAAALNGQTLTAPASTGAVTAAASGSVVTVTFPTTAGNVAAITVANGTSTITGTMTVAETTAGSLVADGTLAVTGMGANGTLELTNTINAASSVTLANSTGTADVLNIKLNGTANLVNTAALTVSNVETINIEATDSSADTTTLTNPAAASAIRLAAADATKITVTGNHGVDFSTSTLTKVTTLDASGVVSVGNAAGATAAQIGTTGAVTFTSVVNNAAITVTTGNGADVINVSSVNDATFLATGATASTVTTGEGDDQITGSAGKDVINAGAGADTITAGLGADTITTGAGNDTVVLSQTDGTDSTLANMDVITDFSANTYGNGTLGAAGTGAAADTTKWTGDVLKINVDTLTITKVDTFVVTNSSDAQTFLQNVGAATTDTLAAALDSSTGKLYIDYNSDGTADSVIQLSGVTTITEAAILLY